MGGNVGAYMDAMEELAARPPALEKPMKKTQPGFPTPEELEANIAVQDAASVSALLNRTEEALRRIWSPDSPFVYVDVKESVRVVKVVEQRLQAAGWKTSFTATSQRESATLKVESIKK